MVFCGEVYVVSSWDGLRAISCNNIDSLPSRSGVCSSSNVMKSSVPRRACNTFPRAWSFEGVISSKSCFQGTQSKRLAHVTFAPRCLLCNGPRPHPALSPHTIRDYPLLRNLPIYQFQWLALRTPRPLHVSLQAPAPPPNPLCDFPSRSVRRSSRRLQGLRQGLR
jgi:hypothetical protein